MSEYRNKQDNIAVMNYAKSEYLLNGRGNEYDVDTRAAHVRRTEGRVDEYLAGVGPGPDRLGTAKESRVCRFSVRHLRRLGTPAKNMRRTHQYMHAMGADEADYKRTDPTKDQPAVSHRIWHGQNPGP